MPVLLTSWAVTAMAGRSRPSEAGTNDRCRPETTTPAEPAVPPPAANAASASTNWATATPPAPATAAFNIDRRLTDCRARARVFHSAYSSIVTGRWGRLLVTIAILKRLPGRRPVIGVMGP
jgi:hypothetical protein